MATTPTYGFQYPGPNDPADMNYWNQQLAAGVEAELYKRTIYGETVQGNYTKGSTGYAVLPMAGTGNMSPNTTGVVTYSDGFSLPQGYWEVGYEISWGNATPLPGSGVTAEHQAWLTLAGSEIPYTHAFQGNGGGRAGHMSGRSMFSVGTDNPRVRLMFGSTDCGSYIVPNGAKIWFKRIA